MSTKDYLDKDYYKVLGVSKDASETEIKKAFHKIARENHPDAHPGDAKAEQRFKEASEAHSVLSDPKQRKEYDETRALYGGPFGRFARQAGGAAGGPTNLDDLFARTRFGTETNGLGDILGGLFGGGRAPGGQQSSGRRGADVESEATIDFDQAASGTTLTLQLRSEDSCHICHGTGARPGTQPAMCPTCQGAGMVSATTGGVFAMSEPCRECHGRGLIVTDPCTQCNGAGRMPSTNSVQVRIPAGVADGQRIRIAGRGAPGMGGGPNGDLYVLIHVTPHRIFGRSGKKDLTVTVPLTYVEASLGADIDVPTQSGKPARIRVPAGTAAGTTMRVRGRGLDTGKGTPGDLLVTLTIAVPPSIGEEAKAALESYGRALGDFDPRADLR